MSSSPAARSSEVADHLTLVLKITLVIFIASSLLDMGLRLDPQDAARGLRNVRFIWLTLFWGLVASPALAFAITRFLPLAPSYTMGLLLMGITPCAPPSVPMKMRHRPTRSLDLRALKDGLANAYARCSKNRSGGWRFQE